MVPGRITEGGAEHDHAVIGDVEVLMNEGRRTETPADSRSQVVGVTSSSRSRYFNTRLEQQRFIWPRLAEGDTVSMNGGQLNQLLDGFDVSAQGHMSCS
jgi:hypothetical protein